VSVTDDRLLPGQLRTRASFVVIRLAALLRQECGDKMASLGLSMHQHAILLVLDEFGAAAQKDVAARLGLDSGDLVAFLDGLQQAGLIARERDVRDRRRQILTITDAGRRILPRAQALLDDVTGTVLEALDGAERDQLTRLAAAALAAHAPEYWTP
jgi:MarR family transcriptional regulator, lower aerobic nicotinate degradation pathway regulator